MGKHSRALGASHRAAAVAHDIDTNASAVSVRRPPAPTRPSVFGAHPACSTPHARSRHQWQRCPSDPPQPAPQPQCKPTRSPLRQLNESLPAAPTVPRLEPGVGKQRTPCCFVIFAKKRPLVSIGPVQSPPAFWCNVPSWPTAGSNARACCDRLAALLCACCRQALLMSAQGACSGSSGGAGDGADRQPQGAFTLISGSGRSPGASSGVRCRCDHWQRLLMEAPTSAC